MSETAEEIVRDLIKQQRATMQSQSEQITELVAILEWVIRDLPASDSYLDNLSPMVRSKAETLIAKHKGLSDN